jgi:hypothetical protein
MEDFKMEDYRTVTELTEDERKELKESLYFQFVDVGDDILDSINWKSKFENRK